MEERFIHGYRDAAKYAGLTTDILKRRVASRLISVIKPSRNKVTFEKRELDEYREKHRIKKLR